MYGFNNVQITNTGFNGWQKAFGGNPNRRSLIISCGVNSVVWVAFSTEPNQRTAWMHVQTPGLQVAPYRDFGPLMQAEVYVFSTMFAAVISCSEIFEIPTG